MLWMNSAPIQIQSGADNDDPPGVERDSHTITRYKPKVTRPSLYKVILLNDDYTPMDFVILILKKFFSHSDGEATRIMLQVHNDGAGIAGVFTHEVAETKVYLVNEFARKNQHPLKCVMEKDSGGEDSDA